MTRSDRGDADVLGLVLLAPVALAAAGLVVQLSDRVDATAQVHTVAEAAVQAAVLQRSAAEAEAAARAVTERMTTDLRLCADPVVRIHLGDLVASGVVEVEVVCTVPDSGRGGLGDLRVTGRARAVMDRFRSRPALPAPERWQP